MMMPSFLGEPYYPAGFPVPPSNIFLDQNTVHEIFILHADEKADQEQTNFLKEYVIYYVNAPIFQLPDNYKEEHLMNKTLDEMLEELLDWGIDPF